MSLDPKVTRFSRMMLFVGVIGLTLAAAAAPLWFSSRQETPLLAPVVLLGSFFLTLLTHTWALLYVGSVRRQLALPGLGRSLWWSLPWAVLAALAPVVMIKAVQAAHAYTIETSTVWIVAGATLVVQATGLWFTRALLLRQESALSKLLED